MHIKRASWCCLCFFNDTATTEIYTLSLHDALPISASRSSTMRSRCFRSRATPGRKTLTSLRGGFEPSGAGATHTRRPRSEEHTSELQSRQYLVCRLLLEKKINFKFQTPHYLLCPAL